MNADKIDIVLYSESFSFISMMKKNFAEGLINIVESFSSIGEMISSKAVNSDVIFVLHNYFISKENLDIIIQHLESKNISFVGVCENANSGFEMMRRGALAIVIKNWDESPMAERMFVNSFTLKVKDAVNIRGIMNKREVKQDVYTSSDKVIAIGSSTGGTEAIVEILKRFPAEMPPILIVQHMPAVFTKMYADRLNDICEMTVWEAKSGDKLRPGLVLIAPGDYQMKVIKKYDGFYVECFKGEKVNGHAPSVDVMFDSVADVIGSRAVGVILTGMGGDGAKGMLKMHQNGAKTIGQDEKSSIVYGMPKVAFEIGAVDEQIPLLNIASRIMDII